MNSTLKSFLKEVLKIYNREEIKHTPSSKYLISDLFVTATSLLLCVSLTLIIFLVIG